MAISPTGKFFLPDAAPGLRFDLAFGDLLNSVLSFSNGNMRVQSFFVLATVQPYFFATAMSALLSFPIFNSRPLIICP